MTERKMKNRYIITFIITLIFFVVIGCAAPQAVDKKANVIVGPQSPPQASLQPEKVTVSLAPPQVREKLEGLTVSPIEEDTKEPEKAYTLSFRKADVHEVLTILNRESKLNFIIDPDVKGEVTVDLREVTLGKALDSLLVPLGLQYKRDANFIRISPVKMQTRMFTLNYLSTNRGGSGMVSGNTGGGGGGGEDKKKGTESFIKVETSDSVDLWKGLAESLKAISSEKGQIVVNKVSGSIIATDFPQKLASIAQFLEDIESTAQRQVMIEAKIIEVTLSDDYQLGIDWSSIAKIGGAQATFTQVLSPATGIFRIGVSHSDFPDFSLLLDAMSKQGKIDILSSPKISALNGQPAIIKVAREDVYWERDTVSAGDGQTIGTSTPRWITVGILLKVTPQIDSNGSIIMDIHPSVREKVGEATSPTGDVAPILDVRETNTVIRVKNGNAIVIAGLLQTKEIREVSSVPFVGKIPLLGALFRKTVEQKKKTELVIMLTPKIVVGKKVSGGWEEAK